MRPLIPLTLMALLYSLAPSPGLADDIETLFDGQLQDRWVAFNAHGGNFQNHARLGEDGLTVVVPDGAAWGKVGLLSPEPVLWLDDFGPGAVATLTLTLDPEATTGLVVALPEYGWGGIATNDPGHPRALFSWRQSADGEAGQAVLMVRRQEVWKIDTGPRLPAELRLRITPGKFALLAEGLPAQETDWPSANPEQGLRMYVYSHAFEANRATSMKLRSITLDRVRVPTPPSTLAPGVPALPGRCLFLGDPLDLWTPAASEGSFEAFGRFDNGEMIVEVPAGKGWTMAGLLSKQLLFRVDQTTVTSPWRLTVVVDPLRTTGFVVSTSRKPRLNMWDDHYTWTSWILRKSGQVITHSHRTAYEQMARPVSRDWSGRFEIDFGPQRVLSGPAEGPKVRMSSTGIFSDHAPYVTIATFPATSGAPSTLVLREVSLERLPPPNMTLEERWSSIPDEAFDPVDFSRDLAWELFQKPMDEEVQK